MLTGHRGGGAAYIHQTGDPYHPSSQRLPPPNCGIETPGPRAPSLDELFVLITCIGSLPPGPDKTLGFMGEAIENRHTSPCSCPCSCLVLPAGVIPSAVDGGGVPGGPRPSRRRPSRWQEGLGRQSEATTPAKELLDVVT